MTYQFQNGETWGEEPPRPTFSPLPREGTSGQRMAARARRAKTDPKWRSRDRASQEALITADIRDARGNR